MTDNFEIQNQSFYDQTSSAGAAGGRGLSASHTPLMPFHQSAATLAFQPKTETKFSDLAKHPLLAPSALLSSLKCEAGGGLWGSGTVDWGSGRVQVIDVVPELLKCNLGSDMGSSSAHATSPPLGDQKVGSASIQEGAGASAAKGGTMAGAGIYLAKGDVSEGGLGAPTEFMIHANRAPSRDQTAPSGLISVSKQVLPPALTSASDPAINNNGQISSTLQPYA